MSDKSSSSSRWPALLLFAFAVFGPPSVATLAFTHAVTQNPWFTAFLIFLYEAAVFIISFLNKIWQRLEDPWIQQIADWLDHRVRDLLSGYLRHYYQWVVYQHRDFDVKGLNTQGTYTLDLEQVFVDLIMDPTPPHETSSDPVRLPRALTKGWHSIWAFLTAEALKDQQLVIIGAPGSGKTTLLKHLALTLVTWQKHRQQMSIPYRLPFLLFLRDTVHLLQSMPDCSLVDAIQIHLQRGKCPAPKGWVERQLAKGHCLLLLDGLDEVANSVQRQQMTEWVQQQIQTYGDNRFILTSRPFGYRSNPLGGVTVLEVRPFTSKQIKRFVHNWYLANERMSSQRSDPGVQMKAEEGAKDLLQRMWNTPALFALSVNPLLLTMIATVHRYRSSLPGKRVELYSEVCEVFLGKRMEARGLILELNAGQKRQVLHQLAYQMMREGKREIPHAEACQLIASTLVSVSPQMTPERFLQLVEETSGLLLEREQGIYSFAHLTFQEYLAAVHVREEGLEAALAQVVGDSWWHETIRLYCAQADASAIISACLAEDRSSLPVMILALECQEEALKIQSTVRIQLEEPLNQGVEDPSLERRRLIAEALLMRRMRQMVPLSETVYRDTSPVTCAEYQVFLDERQEQASYHHPDHWMRDVYPQGMGRTPILGLRPSDAFAFCKWLNKRYPGPWHYRLPHEGEYDKGEESEKLAGSRIEGIGYWIDEGRKFIWLKTVPDYDDNLLSALLTNDYTRIFIWALISLLDHAHVIDRSLVRELTRVLDHIGTLDSDRNLALDYILDFASDLVSSLDSVFEQASDLVSCLHSVLEQASDLASSLDHNLTLTRDLALALTRDLALALTLTRDLAKSLIHDFDPDLSISLANYLAKTLSSNRAHTFNSLLASLVVSTTASSLYLNFDRTYDHASVLSHARDRVLNRAFNRKLAMQVSKETGKDLDLKEPMAHHRLRIRLSTLTLTLILNERLESKMHEGLENKSPSRSRSIGLSDLKREVEPTIEDLLSLYRELAILELRIQGALPASEGILLVKELH